MKISFFYEHGEIDEIGTGHKYRSQTIQKELKKRGHLIVDNATSDIVIIDHMNSQKDFILNMRSAGKKIVLIDGCEEDLWMVDLSISAFKNKNAQYTGIKYIVFPMHNYSKEYNAYRKDPCIFVGLGGYDKNMHIECAIDAIAEMGLGAIVAKSINHKSKFYHKPGLKVDILSGDNYFVAMESCTVAITNGGLTMFQALHYGIPCIAVPQYGHQKDNITGAIFALEAKPNKRDIVKKLKMFLGDRDMCNDFSKSSKIYVDNKGVKRVCDLIEEIL